MFKLFNFKSYSKLRPDLYKKRYAYLYTFILSALIGYGLSIPFSLVNEN